MRRLLLAAATVAAFGCSTLHHDANPYDKTLFYEKYLSPASNPLDAQIQRDLDALRDNPQSATLHNELGALLVQKGFPKDAEVEFERAVNSDAHYYPAWYNLGLVRAARGDNPGARHAFRRTVHYKPGHSFALFQLGLIEEKAGNDDEAVDDYAKAIGINHALLDIRVNPRVVDSRLMHRALLAAYAKEHSRESMGLQGAAIANRTARPAATPSTAPSAPSPQAPAQNIVTPSAPVTDPAVQHPAPNPTAAPVAPTPVPVPRVVAPTPQPTAAAPQPATQPPATATVQSQPAPAPQPPPPPQPQPGEGMKKRTVPPPS